MGQLNQPARWVVLGSGVAGPSILMTSGMHVDRDAGGVFWEVRWNMSGANSSGYIPPGEPQFAAGVQGLLVPQGGTPSQPILGPPAGAQAPLFGGQPAGTFSVQGSWDGVYYTELPVTVSGLYGVSASGTRIIGISGAIPDWIRLVYSNTASSGVFSVAFGARGTGG